MDKDYETKIVKAFFYRNRQERSLFELFSEKKRRNFRFKLSCYYNFIDKDYMIEVPKPNSDYKEIMKLLKSYGAPEMSYSISLCDKIDGKHLPLEDAIKVAVGYGMGTIVSCIPEKLAYLEGEQGFGPPPRYILFKD